MSSSLLAWDSRLYLRTNAERFLVEKISCSMRQMTRILIYDLLFQIM
jgi:hypothetical protein